MRPVACILFIVLTITVLTPMTLFTFMAVNDGQTFLGELDVCHSAAPALSANGDMPCVCLASFTAPPALSVSLSDPVASVFTELILTSSSEHPPRS